MKLPNFFEFESLNALKAKMGIHRNVYGDLTFTPSIPRLTEKELGGLASAAGLDITFEELNVLEDGTFALKNSRVLLYIRDHTKYGNQEPQPRFHLANCQTLKQMQVKNRFGKYVAFTETHGSFEINIIENGISRKNTLELSVCQNCLDALKFDGFNMNLPKNERGRLVNQFKIDKFFEQYPRSLHTDSPTYNSENAPLNTYPANFDEISLEVKNDANWSCQKCGIILSAPENKHWLHTHHKNGLKNDNRRENLVALCMDCHAIEPNHSHLRRTPDYFNFTREFHSQLDLEEFT